MPILLVAIDSVHITPERKSALEQYSGGLEIIITQDRQEMERVLDDVEITIGAVPPDLLGRAPRLKWHQHMGTGTEWLWEHPDAVTQPFILTNCSDDYGVVLGEHMMALMLAFARQLPEHFEAQQRASWEEPPFSDPKRFEMRGKTLLLVGTGSIGKAVARQASGFSMHVIGLRADPSKTVAGIERMYGLDQFHEALSEADLIVNSLPITPSTRRFFDEAAFEHMKSSAYFFNIGRGATVDEAALIGALSAGRIAGAGLDVFEEEPLPGDSALWQLPNVIITPHSGGNHNARYESWVNTAFDNLKRYATNSPLRNLVDKKSGY